MKVFEIFDFLNKLYPVTDAMPFDNVGILIGDGDKAVTNALITLDCSLETVNYAKEMNCRLIITHHPVIFDPLKTVLAGSVQYELIKNDISVISMHTNLDVGIGGINDKLCELLGLSDVTSVSASDGYTLKSGIHSPVTSKAFAEQIKYLIGGCVKYVNADRDISKVLVCSGSGGNYIDEAIKLGFDALVTADVKHHYFLMASDYNIALYDAGHFNTEDIIVDVLAEKLKEKFVNINFLTFHSEKIVFA